MTLETVKAEIDLGGTTPLTVYGVLPFTVAEFVVRDPIRDTLFFVSDRFGNNAVAHADGVRAYFDDKAFAAAVIRSVSNSEMPASD